MYTLFITTLSLLSFSALGAHIQSFNSSDSPITSTSTVEAKTKACCSLSATTGNGSISATVTCSTAFSGYTAIFYITDTYASFIKASTLDITGSTTETITNLSSGLYSIQGIILDLNGNCVCL